MSAGIAPDWEQPEGRELAWNVLLLRSYRLYQEKFWKLFRIALLPALLAYLWRYLYRVELRSIFPSNKLFPLQIVWGWLDGAFYWIVSAFFFAAIAAMIVAERNEDSPAISDAFTRARARIGALTAVALLCWTIFWLGRMVATYALWGALDRLQLQPDFYASVAIFSIPSLMLAGLLARLALTIPVLMDKPAVSLKEALRTSMQKTEGWELFFMMFLAKSAILGFTIVWLGNHGLDWLWQRGVLTRITYPWAARAFYICVAAALESPLFIAFSILYRDSSLSRVEALSATTIE
jgi:hypothetical protein